MCLICKSPQPVHDEWWPVLGGLSFFTVVLFKQVSQTTLHNISVSWKANRKSWTVDVLLLLLIVGTLSLTLFACFLFSGGLGNLLK